MKESKLSDVPALRALLLKENELNNYVFKTQKSEINTSEIYDVGMVLGCSIKYIMDKRIEAAATLYNSGVIKKILVTGGIGKFSVHTSETEASYMKRMLLKENIPSEDIIVEDKSVNTLENIDNSVSMIVSEYGISARVVLITSDFHSKRSKALIEKKCPCDVYSYGVSDGIHDINKWNHTNIKAKKLVRTEAFLLSKYTQMGLINDENIDNINYGCR